MSSLFISYSRKDIETARQLTKAFEGQGLDYWIDWEGIPPTVDWWKEIEKGIEEADIFLFLISPDSARSKVCRQEIEHAVKNGKRLIPVVVRNINTDESPTELRPLNWIFVREVDDFAAGFNKLITAIKTDYEWVQAHRELQVKALEWERSGKENSFHLRGKELQGAEFQLATNSSKEPSPTDLQREYVFNSRRTADRQRRNTMAISIGGVIALAVLAVFGFVQAGLARTAEATAVSNQETAQAASTLAGSNASTAEANAVEANKQASISRARELVAFSANMQDKNFPVSILLGIEAYKTRDIFETRNMLLSNQEANSQFLRFVFNQPEPYLLRSIAISPDGTTAATMGCNTFNCPQAAIVFWNMVTFEPIGEAVTVSPAAPSGLDFSQDGKYLAYTEWAAPNYIIKLIDVTTHQTAKQISFDTTPIISLAFNPNNKMMAISFEYPKFEVTEEGEINLLFSQSRIALVDLNSLQLINDPIPVNGRASVLRFSSDGTILIWSTTVYTYTPSYVEHGTVTVWNVEAGEQINQFFEETSVDSLVLSPDNQTLALSFSGTIRLLDILTGEQLAEPFNEDASSVEPITLAFSSDGKTLAAAGSNSLFLWNMETNKRIVRSFGINWRIWGVTFLPGKEILLVTYTDDIENHAVITDLSSNESLGREILTQLSVTNSIAFSPNGEVMALAGDDGTIRLWSTLSESLMDVLLNGHTGPVKSVAFSPNGTMLASGGDDGKVILWDTSTYTPTAHLTGQSGRIAQVAFSPNGKILASESAENTITLWESDTGKNIVQFQVESDLQRESVNPLTFGPDGKLLVTFIGDTITSWDLTIQPITVNRFPEIYSKISAVSFSPDGKVLGSIDTSGSVILWDVESKKPINTSLPEQDAWVSGGIGGKGEITTYSPDGKWIAFYAGNRLTIWDAMSLKPMGKPMEIEAWSIAFSPDSKSLTYSDLNGSIFLFNLDPQNWVTDACVRAGRNLTEVEWSLYFEDEPYYEICPVASSYEVKIAPEPTSTDLESTPRPTITLTGQLTAVAPLIATPTPLDARPTLTNVPAFAEYVVQYGDTMTSIAKKFNLPIEVILQDNDLTDPNTIIVGQTLLIRISVTPTASP